VERRFGNHSPAAERGTASSPPPLTTSENRPIVKRVTVLIAALVCAGCGAADDPVLYRAADAPGGPGFHRYEYVFLDRELDVVQAQPPFRLVERIRIPEFHSLRGVAVDPPSATVYGSVGGNGGSSGNGALVAYSLLAHKVLWQRSFRSGTDSLAITPNGRALYVPEGERTMSDRWYVVDARTGRTTHVIHAAPGPHNTIVSADGRKVYLGPRNSRFLLVASTESNHVVLRVGPLRPGVRPFTVDEARGLAYTTATGFLGFQVSNLRSGRVLYTVPIEFPWRHSLGTPGHGIGLTPDGRTLAVIDVPNSYVHVYDVARVPGRAPRHVADVRLTHSMRGRESPCGGDCGRAGWLQYGLDGRYLWVADDGDVVSAATNRVAGYVPALANSRYLFELDWRDGKAVRTGGRSGIAPPP
jgi:DNA-binding beta-propeller fold protein YncE